MRIFLAQLGGATLHELDTYWHSKVQPRLLFQQSNVKLCTLSRMRVPMVTNLCIPVRGIVSSPGFLYETIGRNVSSIVREVLCYPNDTPSASITYAPFKLSQDGVIR